VGAAEVDWLDFALISSAVSAARAGGWGAGGGGGGGAWPGGSAPGSRAAGTVRTVPLRATALAALERARGGCAARASRGGACASALTPSELEAKLLEKEGRRHLRSKRRDEKETRRLERVARKQKIGGMLMARQAAALAEGQLEEAALLAHSRPTRPAARRPRCSRSARCFTGRASRSRRGGRLRAGRHRRGGESRGAAPRARRAAPPRPRARCAASPPSALRRLASERARAAAAAQAALPRGGAPSSPRLGELLRARASPHLSELSLASSTARFVDTLFVPRSALN
jgi:hypothetical protein